MSHFSCWTGISRKSRARSSRPGCPRCSRLSKSWRVSAVPATVRWAPSLRTRTPGQFSCSKHCGGRCPHAPLTPSSKLTAMGKDERAISVSGYVHREFVKYTDRAFEKTVIYKRHSRNHLLDQV